MAPRALRAAATREASQRGCAIRSELAALILAVASSAATAQSTDDRLRALESEVGALKKRVEALEGRPSAAAPQIAPGDCPGADKLRISQTQAEVRAILGEPTKISSTPLQIVWFYPCGRAYFDAGTQRFVGAER